MARSFTFKDANALIKAAKELLNGLSKSSVFGKNKLSEAIPIFYDLSSSSDCSLMAEEELLHKKKADLRQNSTFLKLILPLYQIKLFSKNKDRIIELHNNCQKDLLPIIKMLFSGKNPVFWFFSSRLKKAEAEAAYDYLASYLKSNEAHEIKNLIAYTNGLNRVQLRDAWRDYYVSKEDYLDIIQKAVYASDSKPLIASVAALSKKANLINDRINEVELIAQKIKGEIKEAIDFMMASKLLSVLRTIPIEELNRDKRGIRIKPLRDAGYTNIAEIYAANRYNIAAIYGISEDNAYTIKRLAEGFAQQARKDLKFKLSYDVRNKASNTVVKRIHLYRLGLGVLKAVRNLRQKYNPNIERQLQALMAIQSGRFWPFYSDERIEGLQEDYRALQSTLNGEYHEDIFKYAKIYLSVKKDCPFEEAWEDFKQHSIEFYNIIEEFNPGVLGNDSMYGLPEELARQIQEQCYFPDGLLCTLRRYQEWGVKYILHQERVLLGDEMGLGKTIQAIATMVSLKNTGATHFVVVCPASVITNWCREIAKHSRLKVMKAHGAQKASIINAWLKVGGVIVTTYESTTAFQLDPSFRYSQLIVDEAHFIKNRSAARTSRVIELSHNAERVLFMTGTALENNVDEMISLIDVLRPDIASSARNIAFMASAPQFRQQIAPVYYRRKREDVLAELPDLIENEEWCTMSSYEESLYEEAVLNKDYMGARRISWNVDNLNLSCKMNRLREIIEDAKEDGRKILVFSYFLDTIAKICESLGNICLNPINGSIHPSRRQAIIDEFDAAPAGTVLCAQIQSGGTGLNIQAASVVVICEPQLKPSIENQAISRAYRMGQSRNVQVFRLLCENSIDEKILDLLKEKQAIFDAFADKSVAAKNVEIDDKGLGDIIKEEIERINRQRGNPPKKPPVTIQRWEKAKDTYRGLPVSVTGRIKMVAQPNGGYIRPKQLECIQMADNVVLHAAENIHPGLIGTAVDYMTRYLISHNARQAFDISLAGARLVSEIGIAEKLASNIIGLDNNSIINAIKLSGYDVAFRVGPGYYKPIQQIAPDKDTIANVRMMLHRVEKFLETYGPIVESGFTFEGAYTRVIGSGDGDYLTEDTLWDMKVSKYEPSTQWTFQLLIYYVMGLHTGLIKFKRIKYLGIFNPRLNKVYRYDVSLVSKDDIKRIEEEVIGY